MHLYILIILINILLGSVSVDLISDGYKEPIYVASIPNSDELLVLEQRGVIYLINSGTKHKAQFLDIRDRVHYPLFPGDEMGLLGLAFDPNYTNNGYYYLNYVDKNDSTTISRFFTNGILSDRTSEKIVLKFAQPYSNHNGGSIEFNRDNYLFIATGDGGSAGDPENRAQDLTSLLGKILKIKIDNKGNYTCPISNPYYNNQKHKSEIWAYGLRNPWRFTFDKLTGDMYIADVGQNLWEEINYVKYQDNEEKNFGWNILEGYHCFPENSECDKDAYRKPIFEYPNNANYAKTLLGIKQNNMDGCSITGGYVYRGSKIEELYGRYIFGDYCTGKVWSINVEGGIASDLQNHTNTILDSMGKRAFYLSSFGQDRNGEILLIDYNGSIYKLVSN